MQSPPVAYQERDGRREPVAARYRLAGRNEVRYEIGAYDRSRPLVIDPILKYATYLGGSAYDFGAGIAVDAAGNAYVAAYTPSTDFPTKDPIQSYGGGAFDVVVSKLNPAGSALVYSTFIGGENIDLVRGIAVDAARQRLRDRRHSIGGLSARERGADRAARQQRRLRPEAQRRRARRSSTPRC